MKDIYRTSFFLGTTVLTASLVLAFHGTHNWYFLGVIGAWLFFDYLAREKDHESTLDMLINNKMKFLKAYLLMLAIGATIELVGRGVFSFWDYPRLKTKIQMIVLLLYYPFILISLREMHHAIGKIIRKKAYQFGISMLLGIILWEIPNMFSHDWVYHVSIFPCEVLGMNVFVVLGWIILIWVPVFAYDNYL